MAVDFVSRKQQIFDQRREKIEGKTAITNYRRRSLVTTLAMTVVATEEAEVVGVGVGVGVLVSVRDGVGVGIGVRVRVRVGVVIGVGVAAWVWVLFMIWIEVGFWYVGRFTATNHDTK
uniref:Transmembrane protein n=1 Tax=Lactuca sativa TaxID=4236 RepID=A0A9R1X6E7_LACSA|nr:hypothetical protein LSAT_V11C600318640 [Lactuca sativa]